MAVTRSEAGSATASVIPVDPSHAPSVQAASSAEIRLVGDRLTVFVPDRGRMFRTAEVVVELGLPASSHVAVRGGRVSIHVRNGLEMLHARLGAGAVDVDVVEDTLSVKAGQVDVAVEVAGLVGVVTGQGTLRAGSVGGATFKTGHGEVELGRASGQVLVKGGAVRLVVREAGPGELSFDTGSGSARVAVVPGTTVQLDLTSAVGDVRCDLPMESSPPEDGAGLRLRLRTGLGDLLVMSAAPVTAP
jgi:hypothetical protein